jgi:hypothetical protein
MRTTAPVAAALAAVAALAAGCGATQHAGPPPKLARQSADRAQATRFDAPGFGITFRYPAGFQRAGKTMVGDAVGRETARAGVGLSRWNLIVVSRYRLRSAVTDRNVAKVRPEVDGVIAELSGRHAAGSRVRYGGFPGYAYRVRLARPRGAESRLVVLFDRAVEYFFNCQSTPRGRPLVEFACAQALGTLRRR